VLHDSPQPTRNLAVVADDELANVLADPELEARVLWLVNWAVDKSIERWHGDGDVDAAIDRFVGPLRDTLAEAFDAERDRRRAGA
jgi:hypothetical protein